MSKIDFNSCGEEERHECRRRNKGGAECMERTGEVGRKQMTCLGWDESKWHLRSSKGVGFFMVTAVKF